MTQMLPPGDACRQLLDALAEGVVWHDGAGRVVDANRPAAPLLGLTRDELLGRSSLDPRWQSIRQDGSPWPGEDHPAMVALRTSEPQRDQIMGVLAPDAGRRWLSIHAMPILRSEGAAPVGAVVSFVDVTPHIEARDGLARLSAEQAAVLDNELVGIVRTRERRIAWKNRAFDRFFGYADDELCGQDTSVLYPDADSFKQFGSAAGAAFDAGRTFRARQRLRRKDGSAIWVESTGMRTDDGSGECLWFSIDISDTLHAEELRIKAAQLEAENRQLERTQRLQAEFLSGMSHELRTPLNAIIGFADLLYAGVVPVGSPRYLAHLGQIASSGRQLLGLIDAILATTQAESGPIEFSPVPVFPAIAVREVVDMLEPQWRPKPVAVSVDVAAELDVVHLDPLRLRQVLLNYVDNAIKFSHPGGTVEIRVRPDGAGHLLIEVEDRGIGIPDDELPSLFRKFHQVRRGGSKVLEGAGLGLALNKLIVEAQGGTVGVNSVLGQGSVFHARLPRHSPPADA